MGSKKSRKSEILKEECTLGWGIYNTRLTMLEDFQQSLEENYTWIQEVLVGIKSSFSSPEVRLCPKTPSAKRARTAKSKKQQMLESIEETTVEESKSKTRGRKGGRKKANMTTEEDFDNTAASTASIESMDCDDPEDSIRSNKSTRSTRATSARSQGSKCTRSTRSRKAQNTSAEEEEETKGPEPVFSMMALNKSSEERNESLTKTQRNSRERKTKSNERVKYKSPEVIVVDTDTDNETPQPPRKRSKTPRYSNQKSTLQTDTAGSSAEDVTEEIIVNTPETVVKPVIKKKTPIAVKLRTNASASVKKSPKKKNTSVEISPKTIPNFSVLNVKGKAQAYEDHINKSFGEGEGTPKFQKPTNKLLASMRHSRSNTPGSNSKLNMPSPGKPLTRSTPQRVDSSFTSVKSKQSVNESKRRSSVTSVKNGVRLSLSKKRSSIVRHKVRNEVAKGQALTKKDKEMVNESLKSSPEKSPPPKKCPTESLESGENNKTKHYSSPTKSSAAKTRNANKSPEMPKRGTRSKLRLNKKPPPEIVVESSDEESSGSPCTPNQPRNKIIEDARIEDTASDYSTGNDHSDIVDGPVRVPVQRTTRSKMRKNVKTPPSLPTPPSESDDCHTPTELSDEMSDEPRSTRSKMRKLQEKSPTYLSGESFKRSRHYNEDSDETSPPKRQCIEDQSYITTTGTPSYKQTGPRIYKPIKGGTSSGGSGRKPTNLNTTAQSFVNRNTPKKRTHKENQDEKRKMLVAKEKEAKSRLLQRDEVLQKRREEIRKTREEKQKLVAKRREEQEKKEKEVKMGIVKKMENTKDLTHRMLEEKLKEEREKQRQREKKMAEAEQRRKQEEEQRFQLFKEKEMEQKKHEEMLQRKKEFEEKERQRKIEQKKLEEQKRLEMEREKRREEEKLRLAEEQRQRHEEAERREREEREVRERQERDRLFEIQKQEERERQRREEMQRLKEAERLKLQQQKSEQVKVHKEKEDNKQVLAMIQKHNNTLQHSSLQTTSNHNTSTLNTNTKPAGTTLNTSYTVNKPNPPQKAENCDSYDLTPVRKYKNNSSGDNYNIYDIKSDDSTDDEEKPRKKIPSWATGAQLKAALINQYYQPPNLDDIFDDIIMPDLNILFVKKRPRFNKRTSSAIWDSPILKPSGALPT